MRCSLSAKNIESVDIDDSNPYPHLEWHHRHIMLSIEWGITGQLQLI